MTNFHLDEKVVKRKAWDDSIKEHYIKSPVEGYYLEKRNTEILKEYAKKLNLPLYETQKSTIKKGVISIKNNKAITLYDSDSSTIMTFLPIKNSISKEVVAFLSIRSNEGYIRTILNNYRFTMLVGLFVIFSLMLILYKEFKSKDIMNKFLQKKIKEETKKSSKCKSTINFI